MKYTYLTILIIAIIAISSCKRKEKCEEATISGTVKHHSKIIPGATGYIKFGSIDAPSDLRNLKSYDESIVADENGNYSYPKTFKEGDYYLYGIGFDDAIQDSVYGGIPLTVECRPQSENISANVAVVE